MLQQLIMSLVSLIDNFMVAGLGDAKMAAVNVANQINFVYLVVLWTLCGAGGIYMAQFRGAQDEEGMKQAYRFKTIFAFLISATHFILCWAIPEQLIAVMTRGNAAQAEIVRYGAEYLRVVSFTFFPIAISTAIGTAFREIGKPRIPLIISVAATLVNTVGNWLLIYGNLGAPRLEIAGAAIATIIARAVEVVCFLVYVRTRKTAFFVPLSRLGAVDAKLIRTIIGKSGMMLASETTWVVSETVVTSLYNGRGGAEVVAGMAAGWTIANVFFLVFAGIHTATAVIVGGSLGAGKLDEARDKARWLKGGSLVAGCVVALGAVLSTLGIPFVFGNLTPDARSVTVGLVSVIAAYMPVWTVLNAQFAIARSGGDTSLGMYVDVTVNLLLFIPGAFALTIFTPLGPVPMFAIVKTTDFVKYAIARWHLKKERWVKNLTTAEVDAA
ncbi:MAG TPA: MATE family efflux transporter [Treponema sp.]|nr:MATE family efflux transporter [Treponema sp.]